MTPAAAGWTITDAGPAACPGSGQLIAWPPSSHPGGWTCPVCGALVALVTEADVLTLATHRAAATVAATLPLWG